MTNGLARTMAQPTSLVYYIGQPLQSTGLRKKVNALIMTSLRTRLEWLIYALGTNANALSKKAGLARGHIDGIIKGRQTENLKRETIASIAAAAGCSEEWLATGRGDPGVQLTETTETEVRRARPDPYSNRETAIMLLGDDFDSRVLATLRSRTLADGKDLEVRQWIDEALKLYTYAKHADAQRRAIDGAAEGWSDDAYVPATDEQISEIADRYVKAQRKKHQPLGCSHERFTANNRSELGVTSGKRKSLATASTLRSS
jgi:hypothetical protein